MIGKTLGHYEIIAPVGAGGMGEVYRARDTNLERDVAIKMLPEDFAADPDRLARFEREARLLAQLNHANIAAIYGLEEHEGVRFIAMELVAGESLADKMGRAGATATDGQRSGDGAADGPAGGATGGAPTRAGGLSIEETVEIVQQIAAALEAAHDNGIVHRDLKPANVMVTPTGEVKVLDFGLAKAYGDEGAGAVSPDISASPTILNATRTGMIMGTAAYMSPEQAAGEAVDKRADIWAFGVILYEMLTGERLFEGETAAHVLADVLKSEPDFGRLPADAPAALRRLIERCLRKKASRRLRDIGDARIELEAAEAGGEEAAVAAGDAAAPVAAATSGTRTLLAIIATAVIAGLLVGAVAWRLRAPAPGPVQRFVVRPEEWSLTRENTDFALSPDGRHLVYMGPDREALYLRAMDSLESVALRDTARSYGAFFSPGGEWIGFWNNSAEELQKVSIDGGSPITVAAFPSGAAPIGDGSADLRGATWLEDDTIIFAVENHTEEGDGAGLYRVPADGSAAPEEITTVDRDAGEYEHWWPEALPGGRAVLYAVTSSPDGQTGRIVAQDLATGERATVIREGSQPRYLPTGHILYALGGTLRAVAFDADSLEARGNSFVVLEGVRAKYSGAADFTVTRDGTLAYMPGEAGIRGGQGMDRQQLVWVDRRGSATPIRPQLEPYVGPRLSPGRTRVAVGIEGQIWIYDIATDSMQLLAASDDLLMGPTWSLDGERVLFLKGTQETGMDLAWAPADFSGGVEILLDREDSVTAAAFAPSGDLVFSESTADNAGDLLILRRDGEVVPLLQTPANEIFPAVSPDGEWLAYVSDVSGTREVYVQPFPGGGERTIVSSGGGVVPVWSGNGREILYRHDTTFFAVAYTTEGGFAVVPPRQLLFDDPAYQGWGILQGFGVHVAGFDVDADRLLMLMQPEEGAGEGYAYQFNFVLNWLEEFRALAERER